MNENDAVVALDRIICERGIGPFLDAAGKAMGEHANAMRDSDDKGWKEAEAYAAALKALGSIRFESVVALSS